MKEISLLELRDLKLLMRNQASEEAVDLLVNTIWGTPGGAQYSHLDTASKIHDTIRPWFIELRKGEQLLGTLCLAHRKVEGLAGPQDAFYIRYYSMASSLRRKISTRSGAKRSTLEGNSLIKRAAKRFFDNPTTLMEAESTDHAILYAFVELENERSKNMVKMMGFESIGKFETLVFSRLNPKTDIRVRRADTGDQAEVRKRLAETYKEHVLFTDQHIFYQNHYWILEENGEIIAGMQANPVHWTVENLPGFSGKVIMNLVPYVPLLSRIFNPRKFNYLAVEGVFCKEGRESEIYTLLSHCCKANEMHMAMFWLDVQDPRRKKIRAAGRLGLMERLNDTQVIDVIGKFIHISDEEISHLREHPVYISAFDVT